VCVCVCVMFGGNDDLNIHYLVYDYSMICVHADMK
jgi:hypothetical protein